MSDRTAHQPVERRARVVAAEVALTCGTAYLVGLCAAIGAATDQAPAVQLILGVVGIGLILAYGLWLLGGSGVALAVLNLPLLILAADALLVDSGFLDLGPGAGVLGPGLSGIVPPLLAVLAAATGLCCGLVLPGPRRLRLTHGVHHQQVNSAALLSEGAVLERLRTTRAVSRTAPPAPTAPAAPTARDAVSLSDSTQEDHALTPDPVPHLQPPPPHPRSVMAVPRADAPGTDAPGTDAPRVSYADRRPDPMPEPDADPGPEADPGPDPMPEPDPMPDPDPMPQPDDDRYAELRDVELREAEQRAIHDAVRSEQHLQ